MTRTAAPRRRRTIIAALAVVVVIWAVGAAAALLSVRSDVDSGVGRLEATRAATTDLVALLGDDGDGDGLSPDEVARELDLAAQDLGRAADTAGGWVLAPLRVLPVAGRQLTTVSTIVRTTADATAAVATAVAELDAIGARPGAGPEERLATVQDVASVLDRLSGELRDPDLGTTEGLQIVVASIRNRVSTELAAASDAVDSAAIAANGVADLLTGPSTYLVLAANNAEMRAGSGMFLQVGTISFDAGRTELSEFVPAEFLVLDEPGATLDADVAARWGGLAPDREFRNLNLTPRFDESARMAAELWAASGRGAVDGVMSIDVAALRQLLELVGPIEVDDADGGLRTLGPHETQAFLLREQYAGFDDREDRREVLGSVLSAAFRAFDERPISAEGLLDLLRTAGAGRHLLLWSPEPSEQAAWVELGVSGQVEPDSMMLSLINRGANKLDPFVELSAVMSSAPGDDVRTVTVEVTATNTAPPGLPAYVAGPQPIAGAVDPGDYVGVLALTVPGAAGGLTVDGGGGLAVIGDDGPTRVIGTNVRLPAGSTAVVRFDLQLPDAVDEVTVLPSARLPRVSWTAGEREFADSRPRPVDLDRLG